MNGPFGKLRRFAGVHLFVTLAGVLLLVDLWLTAEIRILPTFAPADMSNFIEHARSIATGLWFGGYDNLTLVKRPFFPMFLALLQEFGIPLPLGHTLLYALACFTACAAIRPVITSQAARAGIFGVLLFNPFSYNDTAWIANRSQVNPALALLTIACAVAIVIRRRRPGTATMSWSLGLGTSFAAFWLTREEAVWMLPALAILLGAYVIHTLRVERSQRRSRLLTIVVPAGIWLGSIALIMTLNGLRYGWYVVEEQQAPEFVSAYNSLARIDVPRIPYIAVSKAARAIAYSVSPAARELEAPFDGPGLAGWKANSCRQPEMICGTDFSRGFFLWAFRDAVQAAGHYTSGSAARAFYLQLAKEIDGACTAKTIACRRKALTMTPPIEFSDLPALGSNFLAGLNLLVEFKHLDIVPPHYTEPPPNIRFDYGVVVRSVADFPDTVTFSGWMLHRTMKSVVISANGGQVLPLTFTASPDVEQVTTETGPVTARQTARGMNPGEARFHFSIPCLRCQIIATAMNGSVTRIPLSATQPNLQNADVIFHLESAISASPFVSGDDAFKSGVLQAIGAVYQFGVPPSILAALALFARRLILPTVRRSGAFEEHVIVTAAIVAASAALLLILAVVTTFSYYSFYPEYMSPLYPLALFASSFAIATELRHTYGLRRRLRIRPASTAAGA